jgi:GAF domain-containing protein
VSSDGFSKDFVQSVSEQGAGNPPLPTSPVAFEDVTQAPFLAIRREALGRESIRSMLVIPLHVHDQMSGTVVFYWKTAHKRNVARDSFP